MKMNSDGRADFSAAASAAVTIRKTAAHAQKAGRRNLPRILHLPAPASSSQKGQNLPGRIAFIPDASVVLLSDSPSPVEFDGVGVNYPSERPMVQKTASAAIETQSEKVADSAKKLKESSVRIEDSADRRTELASNRTALAAERTYSAWIRTGLFSLASGAGAKGVLAGLMPMWIVIADSSALIVFSIFCFCAAVWRFNRSGATRPGPDVPRIDARILLAMSAFLSIVSLAALWGVLAG